MKVESNIYTELLICLQYAILKGDNELIKSLSRDLERWATLCIMQDKGEI